MDTALITGASRGIGREAAQRLASEGWRVLSGVRNPKSAPPGTHPEAVDMADPGSIAALAERLRARNQQLAEVERLVDEAPGGYGATKATINALARLFANELRPRGILVNAVSPGWCRTDMGGRNAPRSAEQGAASILWGVRLPPDGPTGGVFQDGKAIA